MSARVLVVDDIDVRMLWPHFDLKSLYRLSWGGANAKGEAWEALVRDEFAPRLAISSAIGPLDAVRT